MKILLTGAHFTPAVATIEELKKYKNIIVIYVGRKTTMEGDNSESAESQILPSLGIKYIPITAGRLQRSLTVYTIPSLLKIPVGLLQALFIILRERPDVILSFGGYVAVPVVISGWLFSIPIIVHEQTLVSGLANKLSSFFANKIALSFRKDKLDEKTIITGNPIRKMILSRSRSVKHNGPLVLITGGNQGSHIINKTVEDCLDKLTGIASVIHVTGNQFKDFEKLEELGRLGELGKRYVVRKWIGEEYGEILSKVDFVVSRAGINTLTEMAFVGKPGLVIPIPYLFGDEQNKNAKYFEAVGLVKILPQSKLSADSLFGNIKAMLKNLDELKKKAKDAKEVIIPDAAKRLALETILLALKME